MNFNLVALFSFSIWIAGIIALARYNRINKAYNPFLFCIWIGCLNELLSVLLSRNHISTMVNVNIYVLIEAILIVLLFKNLKMFDKSKTLFTSIIAALIAAWIIDTFVLHPITIYAVYFRIFYSFIIVLLSISILNEIIANHRKRNATFLLCIGFIIYFTFKVLVYAFWVSELSPDFLRALLSIMTYINLFTNLIYAIAVLWMPRRLEFSLPS